MCSMKKRRGPGSGLELEMAVVPFKSGLELEMAVEPFKSGPGSMLHMSKLPTKK